VKKYLIIIGSFILLAALSTGAGILVANYRLKSLSSQKSAAVPNQESAPAPSSKQAAESVPETTPAPQTETASTVTPPDTSKAEAGDNSFSFAIIGDTQTFSTNPNGNLEKASRSLSNQKFDLAIDVGDLVHSCEGGSACDNKYNSWKEILGSTASKIYAVQGNHDRTSSEKSDASWSRSFNFPANGPDGFKDFTYSFDYKNSHFIALDSEKPDEHIVNNTQRNWLEQDLSKNTKENTFVFFHEPAFQMCQDPDSLVSKPAERDALWNILKKYKVTAIFNGHCHMFARRVQDGIHQFVVGDTDSTADDIPYKANVDFGLTGGHYYALASVSGKQINFKLYSVSGDLLHEYNF
jgi:predicted phosphodiesterase